MLRGEVSQSNSNSNSEPAELSSSSSSSIPERPTTQRPNDLTTPWIDRLPLDDPKVYELLRSTQTIGVFQVESPGMRELLGRLQPEVFEDLIAQISLFRPGPLTADMINPQGFDHDLHIFAVNRATLDQVIAKHPQFYTDGPPRFKSLEIGVSEYDKRCMPTELHDQSLEGRGAGCGQASTDLG